MQFARQKLYAGGGHLSFLSKAASLILEGESVQRAVYPYYGPSPGSG